ncbi:MAG: NAD-dependent epimerase/dehydratase family protein [Bacteriovoracaceae bacterium]|jgi:2-alkyl-3-oxoalkanoate reductase|nr:NAD-dependent epimerase/dehydratase family protein [Bacteriovoracaceae bacterium]
MPKSKLSYNILMTGAGGFLGFNIAKDLINSGHKVTNFSRSHHEKLDTLGIKTITGNLNNPQNIKQAFEKNQFDSIIHVAAKIGMWGRYRDFYEVNVEGTKELLNCAKKYHIKRFIFTSSPSVVFEKDDLEGVDETQPYPKHYLSAYAKTKAIAEDLVLKEDQNVLRTAALRPHLIYGEDDPNLLPRLIKAKIQGRLKQIGLGQNLVDVIYVENAAKAHTQILESIDSNKNIQSSPYFIGQERPVNLWEFVNQLLESCGQTKVNQMISFNFAYIIGSLIEIVLRLTRQYNADPPMTRFMACQLAKSHYFCHKNASKDFNYSPSISIEESLHRLRKK